jgi:alkylation response protein AidB-like acyl-CoA dehydrogenase
LTPFKGGTLAHGGAQTSVKLTTVVNGDHVPHPEHTMRLLPTDEAGALIELTQEIADGELAPRVDDFEARGEFPREVLRTLGRTGLLGLPYPAEYGGGGQPYEVYLQVLEVLAGRWLAVAEAVSVHTLACYPVAAYGSDAQRKRFLPDFVGGELLGAYCLSEPQGGSDAASLATTSTTCSAAPADLGPPASPA